MTPDPIMEEVRSVRDAYAREHGYDVRAIVAALQREEAKNGRPVVTLPPKRLTVEQQAIGAGDWKKS